MLELVGRYQIQARIGEGAMADVYRAYDPGIGRVLAIKVLKAEFRENRQYAVRFLREAKAAGALSHPNIVTIYDVGESDGYPYIAMELLDGETLDRAVAGKGRVSAPEALAIGTQLGEALRYAHSVGVVHRDIKPSNIMLAPDGRSIKILDFGIARVAEADSEADSLKTQVGQVLGTPRYMSPEQALGEEIDGRSDLFSTGVVLYELVTGERAFAGASAATLALQITQQDPKPIAALAPDCPRGLQFIIDKLLAKKPERRFQDGGQLVEALQREGRALEAEQPQRKGYLPIQVRQTLVMSGVTAAALLVSVGLVLSKQDKAMERMALSSGVAIASFVASNAALTAADNATLPPDQRDWAPVNAFVRSATTDANIRQITVVDAEGLIRGASDPEHIGQIYETPRGEKMLQKDAAMTVTSTRLTGGEGGFRFVRPIIYAGRSYGMVDVTVSTAELEAAGALSRWLLAALSLVTLGVVVAVSYAGARLVAAPVARLKQALSDAADGQLDFRISHNRKDEFGELFDGFNRLAAATQERLHTPAPANPSAMDELKIAAAAAERAAQALDRTRLFPDDDAGGRTVIAGRS